MIHTLLILILLAPLTAFAQAGYNPLVNLPGGIGDPVANFDQFLNTLYAIAIAVAALLVVIKIVIGGVKYMLSDVVTNKASAKADIQGALFGLIIVIGAVLILDTINPGLTTGNLGGGGSGVVAVNRAASTAVSTTSPDPLGYQSMANGDSVLPFPPDLKTPLNRSVACQQVKPSECSLATPMYCYRGDYYQEGSKVNCIVRAQNNLRVGTTLQCSKVFDSDGTTEIGVDCSEQIKMCTDANYTPQVSSSGNSVRCNP